MRILLFCLFFLGCQSQPAVYEIIEVKHGSKVRDMHGSVYGGQGRQMPKVHRAYRAWARSDCDLENTRKADSESAAEVFRSY
jgi:hypothetical protein